MTFHNAFEDELSRLPLGVKEVFSTTATLLISQGPMLDRPHADTLSGSGHSNIKDSRFNADDGEWRAAFAFDLARKAITLVAGDKTGVAQKRFYTALIAKADARFSKHLDSLKG